MGAEADTIGAMKRAKVVGRLGGILLLPWLSLTVHGAITIQPWAPLYRGIDFTTGQADTNEVREQKVFAMRVDLTDPTVEFFSTPSNGNGSLETYGQTTTTFVGTYGVAVGVNANFFSPVSTIPNDPRDLSGLAISQGNIVSPYESIRPSATITRSNQVAFITTAPGTYSNIWTAVSGSDLVLIGGVPQLGGCVTSFCLENPRTALGLSQNGRYFYMMVIDGRQPGWSDGATLEETGQWLLRLGAWTGLNLDGGGSSAMAVAQSGGAVLLNRPSGGVQRVDGNHIGVFAQPLAQPPVIAAQPLSQTILAGQSATFSVGVGGAALLSYFWQLNGHLLPGATSSSYTVANAQSSQGGEYSVLVTNAYGSVLSSNALLSVLPVGAWGDNSFGQISPVPSATNVVAIAAGGWHSLTLRADGMVVGWGDDWSGQCIAPAELTNAVAIAAGGYHSLAIRASCTVVAWGNNDYDQCAVPPGLENVYAVAAGTWHSVALRTDGTVVAWGDNSAGQTAVPHGLANVVAVAAGGNHSLALKADGTVVGWGENVDAHGHFVGQSMVPSGLTNALAIAAGEYHSLCLRADSTVIAWGDNSDGQCSVPLGLTNAVAVAGGGAHSLALKADGTVAAWGADWSGQCSLPPGLTNIAAVSAGADHTLVLPDGALPLPRLFHPARRGNQFSVLLQTASRRYYALEFTDSPGQTDWSVLPAAAGNGALRLLTDPAAGAPHRFYRVKQW